MRAPSAPTRRWPAPCMPMTTQPACNQMNDKGLTSMIQRAARCMIPALLAVLATLVAVPAEPLAAQSPVIVVSIDQKRLWYLNHRGDTLFTAPVATGKEGRYELNGKIYDFRTPRGQRRVLAKDQDPAWVPPDWHYFEKAVWKGIEPVHLEEGMRVVLSDSSVIEVKEGQVGRRAYIFDGRRWTHAPFRPFTPGFEIIFDDKMFIPPMASPQRRIPDALGPYKLVLGEGYLIHGTNEYNEDTIGGSASHGCIRMRNEDVTRLFHMVDIGTTVRII